MGGERTLTIKILGNAAGGSRALQDVEKASGQTSSATNLLGGALTDVKAKLLGMVPGGTQAEQALTKVKGAGDGVGFSLKGAVAGGAAAAGVAIAGMAAQGVQKFADVTLEVTRFKNATGASSEEASKLVAVAHGLGVDTDALTGSMFKSGAAIAQNADKFKALGIEIAHNKDGTVDLVGTLANASEAYQKTSDATVKDAIAKQLGGKRGQELIPILKGGTAAIKEFGDEAAKRHEVFTDSQLRQGVEYRKALREVGEAVSGLEVDLAEGLVPTLTDTAHGLTEVIDLANQVTHPLGGVAGVLKDLGHVAPVTGPLAGLSQLKDRFDEVWGSGKKVTEGAKDQAAAQSALKAATDADAQSQQDMTKAIDAQKQALDGLIAAEQGQIDADIASRNANRDMATALADLAEKQKAAATAGKDGGAAQAALKEQVDKTAEAVVAAAKATAEQQEQQILATGGQRDAARAQDELRDALQKVANTLAPGSELRTRLDGYINDLKPTGQVYEAQMTANFSQAQAAMNAFGAAVAAQPIAVPIKIANPDDFRRQVQSALGSIGGLIFGSLKDYERLNGTTWRQQS